MAVLLGGWLAVPLAAQEADTLRGAPAAATTASFPAPVAFPVPGDAVGTALPARTIALDPVDLLGAQPGSFVYDFGTPGWPHGWSPYGVSPNTVGLYVDGLPFNDLITGRARYDLIPFTFMEPLRVQPAWNDAPVAVQGRLRAFDVAEPLTEIRYRTSNKGLQSVTVAHVQQRRPGWLGNPARLNVLFGYGGHAARGEYPGSRLRRARQLLLRLQYARPGWAVEVKELFNRRRVGAHGGVLPIPGAPYASIYQRLGARVEREEARRETIRNDLSVTLQVQLAAGYAPLRLTGFWTNERFQYRNAADTLTARMRRLGVQATHSLLPGRLHLRAAFWHDRVREGRALPDSLGLTRTQVHLAARDTLAAGGFEAVLEGGYHRDGGRTYPAAFGRLARETGPVTLFVEASRTVQPVSPMVRYGFGSVVRPSDEPGGPVTLGRGGFTVRLGSFDLTAFAFLHQTTDPLDLFVVAGDTVAARVETGTWRRAGIALDLGFRRHARRGLYFVFRPTFSRPDPPAGALPDALPGVFGEARLGARFVLFRNDLDLDVTLRGRYWGAMQGRTLHPPTGLLVLPEAGARPVDAAGTLDLFVSAGVRTAILFLAYENMLSGTALLVGNLIVPDYPLPERRFRFGVFWPIFN
ncbi:putative porin [Rhodocaloribacter litoris]|uniref:putative porin n=1 Tax=Rhodocaloribacter litoris TaxID=2558931 RepID=UPI00141FC16F|nr:putative porin [Rhodocaloribacter litoris]QXD14512.1 putative porin [Rhodocaloribacter litoris]